MYVCEMSFKIKYVFINDKISFLIHGLDIVDSRCPVYVYGVNGDGIVKFEEMNKLMQPLKEKLFPT